MTRKHLILPTLLLMACLALFAQPASQAQTIPPNNAYLPLISNIVPTNTPIPTATSTPVSTPTPMATSTATTMPTPSATPLLYICDRDFYNCTNFSTQAAAQKVFDYCNDLGYGDIHKLDQDNDGTACESLPLTWKMIR